MRTKIDLNKIKQHKDYTFLFLSGRMCEPLRICMHHAGITDYKIIPLNIDTYHPSGTLTSAPIVPLIPGRPRMRPATHLLISHFDTQELTKHFEEIYFEEHVQDYRADRNEFCGKAAELYMD